jgi:hypothetical protein
MFMGMAESFKLSDFASFCIIMLSYMDKVVSTDRRFVDFLIFVIITWAGTLRAKSAFAMLDQRRY